MIISLLLQYNLIANSAIKLFLKNNKSSRHAKHRNGSPRGRIDRLAERTVFVALQ